MEKGFKDINYANLSKRTTVCCITMLNGYEIAGIYSCTDEQLEDTKLRENRAYLNALKSLERIRNKQKQQNRVE